MRNWVGIDSSQPTSFGGLTRSELMSRVRSRRNATTEIRLLQLLREHGLRGFRRHVALPGHPDFVWYEQRVAVFVHGCFWHGHGCARNLSPRRNKKLWQIKIDATRKRDHRSATQLRAAGWRVLTIWECLLKTKPYSCIRRISQAVKISKMTSKETR
jgi:DNA mismatch endonuclease, patch repair protein